MITSLQYSKGYSDALIDLLIWFDTSGHKEFCKSVSIKHDSLIKLLRLFFDKREEFMREKTEFDFKAKLEKRKIVAVWRE